MESHRSYLNNSVSIKAVPLLQNLRINILIIQVNIYQGWMQEDLVYSKSIFIYM